MVIVTDKQYYMNHNLRDLLDLFYKREQKKWDNCIIIDGKERAGKSTLAKTIAYYYAYISKKKFTVDNIYFDPIKLKEDAVKKRNQIFIWDEAAIGGEALAWQNKEIQKLNRVLQLCGKYEHFFIFIIPQFHRLNRYLAIERSLALLHVYSPDLVKRGDFLCLNEAQKTWVYNRNKISESYGDSWSFNGSWTLKNCENLVDEKEYERKKDEAIANLDKKDNLASFDAKKLYKLRYDLIKGFDRELLMEKLNISKQSLYDWSKKSKEMGFDGDTETKSNVLPTPDEGEKVL